MQRGTLALSERGILGVLVDEIGGQYAGFRFPYTGKGWAARRPVILGTVPQWINSEENIKDWVDKRKCS